MSEAEDDPAGEATLFPKQAGERLREARIAQGLELAEVAARTRIQQRYLQAIEDGDFASMQSPTYAVGFAKSYARAVGLNEVEIAAEVRGQTSTAPSRVSDYQPYETDDPARVPSRGLTLIAIVAAALVLAGVGLWYGTTLFRGDGLAPAPAASEAAYQPEVQPAAPPATAPAAGQVTLVATGEVWLRIYDAAGTTILEKTLASGERYEVPASANLPMINVGRPDKLQVLVNGSQVAPLGDGKVAIKDVGISAAALAARNQPAPPPAATPAPAASAPAGTAGSLSDTVPPAFRAEPRRSSSSRATPSRPAASPTGAPATAPTLAPGNTTG